MKKRLLAVLVTLSMLCSMLPMGALAADDTDVNPFFKAGTEDAIPTLNWTLVEGSDQVFYFDNNNILGNTVTGTSDKIFEFYTSHASKDINTVITSIEFSFRNGWENIISTYTWEGLNFALKKADKQDLTDTNYSYTSSSITIDIDALNLDSDATYTLWYGEDGFGFTDTDGDGVFQLDNGIQATADTLNDFELYVYTGSVTSTTTGSLTIDVYPLVYGDGDPDPVTSVQNLRLGTGASFDSPNTWDATLDANWTNLMVAFDAFDDADWYEYAFYLFEEDYYDYYLDSVTIGDAGDWWPNSTGTSYYPGFALGYAYAVDEEVTETYTDLLVAAREESTNNTDDISFAPSEYVHLAANITINRKIAASELTAVYSSSNETNKETTYEISGLASTAKQSAELWIKGENVNTAALVTIDDGGYITLTEEWNYLGDDAYDCTLFIYGTEGSGTTYTTTITQYTILPDDGKEDQVLSWDETPTTTATYGDNTFTETATNSTTGGGAITYTSSDSDVATVDASSGAITIGNAGTATITATAAAVDDTYRETSISYDLVVSPKNITVTVDDSSITYGDALPTDLAISSTDTLVGSDVITDLGATVSTTATATSNAGSYAYTVELTNGNYNVTNVSGTFTISKATPEVGDFTIALPSDLYVNDSLPTDMVTTTATGMGAITVDTIDMTTAGEKTVTFTTTDGTNYNASETLTAGTFDVLNKMTATVTATTNDDNDPDLVNTGKYTVESPVAVDTSLNAYTIAIKGTSTLTSYTSKAGDLSTGAWVGVLISTTKNASETAINADDLYWSADGVNWYSLDGEAALADNDGGDGETNFVFWMNTTTSTSQTRYIATDASGSDMLTLTFNFTAYSAPSTGGGSSGGGTTTTTPDTSDTDSNITTDDNGDTTATVTTETSTTDGTTSATVSEDALSQAITDAVNATEDGTATVEIVAEAASDATAVAVELASNALATLADSDVETLIITSDVGTLEISSEAAASIAAQAGEDADIVITVGQVDVATELSESQQAVVGDSPVFDLSVTSNGEYITSFDGGLIKASLPYELGENENARGLVVWYLDDEGNLDIMFASYDEASGMVTFTTTHFSYYVIAYNELYATETSFTDVALNAYYYLPMLWAIDKEITEGTSDTEFSPNATCTRAQAVTFLWRAAGEPAVTGENPFTDLDADAYYYDAVLWAVANGITAGTSDTEFSPDATCTRDQIVTFLWRFAGEAEAEAENIFVDVNSDAYYYEAVLWAVANGITTGTSDTEFSPSANCTRGQIVTFLYRNLAE